MKVEKMSNLQSLLISLVANGQKGSLTIETTPKMRKKNNPLYGRVKKTQAISCRLQSYPSVKGVDAEDVTPLDWGVHLGPFVVKHKETGQIYFQLKPENVLKTITTVDGVTASMAEAKIIEEHTPSPKGGDWIMVRLENIRYAKFGGQEYNKN